MITDYAALLPRLSSKLRFCPEPEILRALWSMGHKLCAKTELWQNTLDAQDLVADQRQYGLDPAETVPEGSPQPTVTKIEWAELNGALISAALYDLAAYVPEDEEDDFPDQALLFREDKAPGYDLDNGLEVRVVLVPGWTSPYISSFILTHHADTIVSGALSELMAAPDRPWTNMNGSILHGYDWEVGLAAAMNERYLGRKTANLYVNLNGRPWE